MLLLSTAVNADANGILVWVVGSLLAAFIIALFTISWRVTTKVGRVIDRWFSDDPDDLDANLPKMVHQLTRDVVPQLASSLAELTSAVQELRASHDRQAGDIERVEGRLTSQDQVLAQQNVQLARIVGGVKAVDEAVHEQDPDGP